MDTFSEPDIVNYTKVKRLAWAEHMVNMTNDRTLKKTFNTKAGVRNAGRSKLRWTDNVNHAMKTLGVKNWKNSTSDRDE